MRPVLLAAVLGLLPLAAVPGAPLPVVTAPATDEATYAEYGRVFPDPQGCLPDGPAVSPWRRGNVCAADFLGWDEALAGLGFLEARFDRYLEVVNLREARGEWAELAGLDLQSAGLVRTDLSRERFDLFAIHVTDEQSPVPLADRKHLAMMLSLHGDERAGVEGGLRGLEDLVTWAACEEDDRAADACGTEGPFPKPIVEPSESGPTADELLRESVIVFLLGNPDGWVRGDQARAGSVPNRANGNGTDLNRDWPVRGYVEPIHTPWSEPETIGFGRYLEALRDRTSTGRFVGGIDFHNMLTSHALSFSMVIVDEQDYGESRLVTDTARATFADAEARLAWSPHVAPHGHCPGVVPEPTFGRSFVPMCTDQWGTVWDAVGYNASGAVMSWGGSPFGLDAVTLGNEMSNMGQWMTPAQTPEAAQLQVDATKGLLFTQLATLFDSAPATLDVTTGRLAYLADGARTQHPGTPEPERNLPPQSPLVVDDPAGTGIVEFEVLGADDGVTNGGLRVDVRYVNAEGTTSQAAWAPVIQRCDDGSCEDVAVYVPFSDQGHAGVAMAINDPPPGRYRVIHRWHPNLPAVGGEPADAAPAAEYHVNFTAGKTYPEPEQLAYDVSRLDFFHDLADHVAGRPPEAVSMERIAGSPGALRRFDTLVIADGPDPGSLGDDLGAAFVANLRRWVERGGTLVLTDGALRILPELAPGIGPGDVTAGFFNTGWMDFHDGTGPTDDHALAAGVLEPGVAIARVAPEGAGPFEHAKELYTAPPLGFYVSPDRSANAVCNTDRCDAPVWVVDQSVWEQAGGSTAARSFVRTAPEPSADGAAAPGLTGVTLGELALGAGRVRIVGALLPEPTQANHHPYGLSAHAVTPAGYRVLENVLQ